MKRLVGDYLSLNRQTPVRLIEGGGVLYVDHALSISAPVVEYEENTLFDFAAAYYPKRLLDFAEKYGTLFNVDLIRKLEGDADSWTDATIPTEQRMRDLLADLNYPEEMKRKVTQDIRRIHSDCLERDKKYDWELALREYFGDWVAARAMVQKVLELLGGASLGGVKGKCPDFSINLANAPRYREYLTMSTHKTEHLAYHVSGKVIEDTTGLFVDGSGVFRCHKPNSTVEEVVSELVTMHIEKGIKKECIGMEIHESFSSLLQVIWYQIPEQIGSRLVIDWCENPRCRNVMLRFLNDEKHACCASCQQALKEGR